MSVVFVEDPAAAIIIKTLINISVAADLGHAVVTTIVPFTIVVSFALGFIVVVSRAETTFEIAEEVGLGLLDVAHGIRRAVRPVVSLETSTSTSTSLGISPLVPDATFIFSSSTITIRFSQVGVFTATVALSVGGQSSIGLEFASHITVTLIFVGAISGADTSAAIVDTVPSTTVGILGKRRSNTASFSVVAEAAVFETVGSIPVALFITNADVRAGVVTLPATALSFKEFTFSGNLFTFRLGPVSAADLDLTRVAISRPFTISISKTFINILVQARADRAAVGGGVEETVGVHLAVLAETRRIGALTFLALRISIIAFSIVVPAAEILGEAGILGEDKTVGSTAADISPFVPDTGRIGLALVFSGVVANLALANTADVFTITAGIAGRRVAAEIRASSFNAHTLGERIAVLGGALGGTFSDFAVLASDTTTNKVFGNFLATHLPAASRGEALGGGSFVVPAVRIRVAETISETIARKNHVGVDGGSRRGNRSDEVEGVAHAVEEHGIEVINTDGAQVLFRLVVNELGESNESILVGIEGSTDNIDTITLELLDDGRALPTNLGASDEDSDLGAVSTVSEFREHGASLGDGIINNHEVRGVDVGASKLEFVGESGVVVGEVAVGADVIFIVVTSLDNTDTDTRG